MESLELFAGAGGLAIGTARAGFGHVAAIERDMACAETLRANGLPVMEADAAGVDYSPWAGTALVSGGPPCQPFSSAGKHLGRFDPRDMFPTLVRAVREVRPRLVLVENVKGLLRTAFSGYLEYVLLQLSRPGVAPGDKESPDEHMKRLRQSDAEYEVARGLLNAADFGVPQTRERVFILASKSGNDLGTPSPTHSRRSLLRSQWVTGEYWARHGIEPPEPPARLSKRIAEAKELGDDGLLPWRTVRDAISDIMYDSPARKAKSYKGHTGSDLDMPSKTLKAGVHGVPGGENMVRLPEGDRHYTVREAARVQGFPDSWSFPHSWTTGMRQIGNAVPPPLAEAVTKSLARATPPVSSD